LHGAASNVAKRSHIFPFVKIIHRYLVCLLGQASL